MPARLLVSSVTALRNSPSIGVPSLTGIGSTLMGRGSPGESLRAYNAIRLVVCHTIVCGQMRVVVSNADQYHPFRWRKASFTSPPISLSSIASPTWSVLAAQSPRRAAHICRCIFCPLVWHILPVRRSMVRWLMSRHVSLEIQSLSCRFWGSAFAHCSFSASNCWVSSSCGPVASRRGRRCCFRQ